MVKLGPNKCGDKLYVLTFEAVKAGLRPVCARTIACEHTILIYLISIVLFDIDNEVDMSE